jgi:hypothetical protein
MDLSATLSPRLYDSHMPDLGDEEYLTLSCSAGRSKLPELCKTAPIATAAAANSGLACQPRENRPP